QKQINSATKINHSLNLDFSVDLRLIEMVGSFVPRLRAVPRVVRDQGDRASSGINFRFRNEFCPRAISPVAEENRSEWAFSFRDDQICTDGTSLRTCIG